MKGQWKGRLLITLLCNLFLASTVMVFAPLEVYVGSFFNFYFGFDVTWKIMTLAMLAVVVTVTAAEMLLPKRMALLLNALTVVFGLCCYVQMMFLNGKMVSLTGAQMRTTRAERIVNLCVWAAILAVVLGIAVFILRKKKDDTLNVALGYVSAMLMVMQTVGLLSVVLTTDMTSTGGFMLAGDGRYEVAPKNNTLVFVLDTTENTFFEKVLRDYPDVYEAFSGFTYYSNTTGMHSRTYPALPYLLTGERCYYDKPYHEYIQEAFSGGTMLMDLKNAGVDSRVYTWESHLLSKNARPYVNNMFLTQFNSFDSVSVPDLIAGVLNISLYKVAPYRLKYELEYSMDKINQRVIRHEKEPYQHYDFEYYHELVDSELTVNSEYEGAFRFYHLFGSHHDMYWDENMRLFDVEDPAQALRGSLRIFEEFVRKMNEAGVLDETTIIVTADHGQWAGTESTEISHVMANPPNPIMLVKHAGSDMSIPLVISHAPVSHEDLFATVIDGCGLDSSAYGRTLQEITEDEDRERRYYFTAYSAETGGELVLKEYTINGDANTFDNWMYTGNKWDILYTAN